MTRLLQRRCNKQDVASEGVTSEVTTSEAVAVDAAVNDAASAAAEPEMIEVWRPGRAHEERRAKPDHHRRQDRSRYQKPATTPQASARAGATVPRARQPRKRTPREIC
jgi:ATP-dependent RNA helicase SUPV3L1/SUV3